MSVDVVVSAIGLPVELNSAFSGTEYLMSHVWAQLFTYSTMNVIKLPPNVVSVIFLLVLSCTLVVGRCCCRLVYGCHSVKHASYGETFTL